LGTGNWGKSGKTEDFWIGGWLDMEAARRGWKMAEFFTTKHSKNEDLTTNGTKFVS